MFWILQVLKKRDGESMTETSESLGTQLAQSCTLLSILQHSSNTEYTAYSRDSGSILLDIMSF